MEYIPRCFRATGLEFGQREGRCGAGLIIGPIPTLMLFEANITGEKE
jgi:hypothetical protein